MVVWPGQVDLLAGWSGDTRPSFSNPHATIKQQDKGYNRIFVAIATRENNKVDVSFPWEGMIGLGRGRVSPHHQERHEPPS